MGCSSQKVPLLVYRRGGFAGAYLRAVNIYEYLRRVHYEAQDLWNRGRVGTAL